MPLFKIKSCFGQSTVYIWKIEEDFTTLFNAVSLKATSLTRMEGMQSESHQKGFLAVRMLLQEAGFTDFDLYYDDFGKPNLLNGKHISISHSHDFAAICISEVATGIDLEILKDKIVRIAPRFMDISHLENVEGFDAIKKATVVWGVKESIFKIKNEKGISFPNHIFEDDFTLDSLNGKAQLRFNDIKEDFTFVFEFVENYALVCVTKSL